MQPAISMARRVEAVSMVGVRCSSLLHQTTAGFTPAFTIFAVAVAPVSTGQVRWEALPSTLTVISTERATTAEKPGAASYGRSRHNQVASCSVASGCWCVVGETSPYHQ